MAWIKTVGESEATGLLKKIYADAVRRAGKIFGILSIQSLNPKVLRASMSLYRETVLGESEVSRALREMIAVVVSRANGCHY